MRPGFRGPALPETPKFARLHDNVRLYRDVYSDTDAQSDSDTRRDPGVTQA